MNLDFAYAVEQQPVCIQMVAADGNLLQLNEAGRRLLGLERVDQVPGRSFLDFVADEHRAPYRVLVDRVFGGQPGSLLFMLAGVAGAGTRRWMAVHGSPVRDAGGQVQALLGILHEATPPEIMEADRKQLARLESILRAREAALATLMEGLPDLIVRYDLKCRRVGVNSAMRVHIGLPLEQILGRTPEELPLHNTQWFMRVLRGVLADGQPWFGEAAYTDAAGRTHWGELRVVPEFGAGREVLGALGVWRDMTALRQLQDQLRQAQKLEAIGQLASGVAHDFNNMLAAILLHVSMLRTDPRLPPDLAEVFEELEEDARRATSLPRQLLMFSRQQAMQARAIQLESIIEMTLKMLRRIVGERIQINFVPARKPAYIFGDTGMMEQVVFNLCLNARDAMPEGGRLTLATRVVDVDEAHVRKVKEARPGRFVRFTVADTGCGMEAAVLAKIFEPFFTTKETGRGTGLGLMTVFGIVQQHQGWIQVQSLVGRGTKFFIFFPLHTQQIKSGFTRKETAPVPRGGGETILLVEDEASLRQVLAAMISRSGYRVLEAGNGIEATEMWARHQGGIDLLFSDMVIPGEFTGMELARRFRRDKPGLKVILSSGYKSGAALMADSGHSGIMFLAKPVLWNELAKALHTILQNHRHVTVNPPVRRGGDASGRDVSQ